MALDDEALVRQVLRGDREAFGALVERYAGLVHGVVLEVVRQPDEVEDLVQEVFCRAYQELASLRRPSRFAPWVAQIARHLALTHVQREQAHSRVEQLEAWTWPVGRIPGPDQVVEAAERAALVWEALDQLRPEDRQLVVLYHLEGCTFREIARFLDRSAATVRWGLLRAERRLSHKLVGMLRSQVPSGSAGRQRLRRQVLASLPVGLAVQHEAQAATWGMWAWLGKAASLVVSPPALVVGGIGVAGVYLASGGLGFLAERLHLGPAAQQMVRSSQPGVRISIAEWDTTTPAPEGVFVRHQVPPPPLAMDPQIGQAEAVDLPVLAASVPAGPDSASAAGQSPPSPSAAPSEQGRADFLRIALQLLWQQLQQPEPSTLPDLLREISDETGLPEAQVREQLLVLLDRLEAEQRNRSETWGRLVLSGGQEVPGEKADKLLRTLGKDAEKALGSTDSVRVAAVVDRAAQKAGVLPSVARYFVVRLLAAELKIPFGSGLSVPRSVHDRAGGGFSPIVGKSSYPVESLLRQLSRNSDPNTNPLVLFFGVADEGYIRDQLTEVHRRILIETYLSAAHPEAVNRLFGYPFVSGYHQLWRVTFEVTHLDFGIQPDQVRGDGRPLGMAALQVHVEIRSFAMSDRKGSIHLDRTLTAKIASPVSGGRNTLDGLCQAAAQEIASAIISAWSAE